ncbi:MAG TPA: hypothetical protein VL944_01610 [Candidatus Acidoferrum sp.]|nr:hypothetical protein [Candidatus Acidoferrum sp.]
MLEVVVVEVELVELLELEEEEVVEEELDDEEEELDDELPEAVVLVVEDVVVELFDDVEDDSVEVVVDEPCELLLITGGVPSISGGSTECVEGKYTYKPIIETVTTATIMMSLYKRFIGTQIRITI